MNDYPLHMLAGMINDTQRTQSYYEALRRVVKPGDVVVDIGAGTGILSLMACQFGARKVYAIEPNSWIEMGRELAQANGFGDRIEFIRDISTNITLPEQADVIVTDMRGRMPTYQYNFASMHDARQRFLKPGGIMIPLRDEVSVAVIDNEKLYRDHVLRPWGENDYGLDLSAGLRFQTNDLVSDTPAPEDICLPLQRWLTLEYGVAAQSSYEAEINWTVESPRTAHFAALMFEAVLREDIRFTTAPGKVRATIYGSMLLPLRKPIALQIDDIFYIKLKVNQIGDRYIFSWLTRVTDPAGTVKADFKQTTLFALPITGMSKRAPSRLPLRNENGDITLFILEAMDGQRSSADIARMTYERYPEKFSSAEMALDRVTRLAQSFGS